ncbi:NAD(+) diphosphatase [Leucobacter weissii]|uniref:NAD(+) diphosphatase n=1 Tax=Leucobacter weissii TaxID=1983706 RepID=A0A939MMF6_9MICO|nr:NAD(+) diphosphatase [Leucobacter weissii]MBO1901146.1 NAD(+) diphosphatase [Leucobacter weissii]
MTGTPHPQLTGGYIDRDAAARASEDALDAAWAEPGARLLRFREGRVAVRERGAERTSLDLIPVEGRRGPDHYYLGRAAGDPVFAAEAVDGSRPEPEPQAGWCQPFEAGAGFDPVEGELLAVGLALIAWHRTSPFSPRDGGPTRPALGGWARIDAHGGEHFPRTDPVVIVLVEHEDRLLLGSNALWESGRFSLLAGFIEAGESAEQAVIREIEEESGLRVDDVRYVVSQPWPFPRSLMLGFRARPAAGADPDALVPDPGELSEVRWFTRRELSDPAPGIRLPMPMSIARWLIDLWVAEGDGG